MPERCPMCERAFKLPLDLANHMRRKHRIKPKKLRVDNEPSLADDAIEAQAKRAAGLPLTDYEKALAP